MINLIKNQLNKLDKHTLEVLLKSSSTIFVQFISVLARLIISVFLGRILGVSGLGNINFINQFITIIMIFSVFGMDHVIIKKVSIGLSQKKYNLIGSSIFTTLFINGIITFFITIIGILYADSIAEVFNNASLEKPLIIAFIIILPQTIGIVFISGINGYRKIWQSRFLKDGLTSLIVLIGVFLYQLLNIEINIFSIMILYLIGRLITLLSALIYWKKLFKPIINKDYIGKLMLKTSFPLFLVATTSVAATSIDVIMLGWLSTSSKVGLYTVASRLVMFISFFLLVSNSAISPKIATLFASNQLRELSMMVKKVTLGLIVIGFFCVLFFVFLGKPILALWGHEFTKAYFLLMILCCGQIINISTGCSGILLMMGGHERILGYISVFFVMFNLILNYFLIIKYEEIGAAIATSLTISLESFVKIIVAKRKTGILTLPIGKLN